MLESRGQAGLLMIDYHGLCDSMRTSVQGVCRRSLKCQLSARAFLQRPAKRSTTPDSMQLEAERCMRSPLVYCFGGAWRSHAPIAPGQKLARFRGGRRNGRRPPIRCKTGARDAWNRRTSTVSGDVRRGRVPIARKAYTPKPGRNRMSSNVLMRPSEAP